MTFETALPALNAITSADLDAVAVGAAFLGTGSGGDPHLGILIAQAALDEMGENQSVAVMAPEALADDDFTVMVGGMGAPSVLREKLLNLAPLEHAVAAVEQRVGRSITAILPVEMGVANALLPIAFAAQRKIPVIDGDGMGRAFPELQMILPHITGNSVCPMAIVGDAGERIIIESVPSTAHAEALARSLSVVMGVKVTIAAFPMDGNAARSSLVPGTLSLAHAIGRALLCRDHESDPFIALFACLSCSPHYRYHACLGEGRIFDVSRMIEHGWTIGTCRINTGRDELEIAFRNEYLLVRRDGDSIAIVPDLIAVLDAETAIPLTIDDLRYGLRVVVVVISIAECMRTPEALAVVGPQQFGLNEPFVPLQQRLLVARDANTNICHAVQE